MTTNGQSSTRTRPARSATRPEPPGGRRACCTATAPRCCTPMRSRCPTCWTCVPPARILPVVPMFHVNAWGIPYAAALTGATLVLPGRHLDGPSLTRLLNQERVTMSCGVPTVWLGLLQHTRTSGEKLTTVKRIMTGGSAAPPLLIEAFRDELGRHGGAWLGDDRTQPRRHLQRAETRAGRADRSGSGAAHAEAGPRSFRDRYEDRDGERRANCHGTASSSAT